MQWLPVRLAQTAIHFGVDMPVGAKQIRVTVVIVVEESGGPAEIRNRGLADTRRVGDVGKQALAVVVKEDVIVVGESGDEDVHPAIAVVVAHGHTHAGHFLAVAGIRDTRRNTRFRESSVAPIAIKVVGIRVVADEEIRPAIVIEVFPNRLEAKVELAVGHPCGYSDIGEGAVAVIAVKRVWCAAIAERTAGVYLQSTVFAGFELGGLGVEVEIARYEEVQIAIAVIVGKGGTGMPDVATTHPGASGDVGKASVAPVPVQDVRTEVGHEEIDLPVVVVVRRHTPETPAPARHTRFRGDIDEGAVAVIAVQMIGGFGGGLALKLCQCRAVHQVQVQPTVAVVVEPASAAAIHFEHVILLQAAGDDNVAQTGGRSDILKRWRGWRGHLSGQQQHGKGGGPVQGLTSGVFNCFTTCASRAARSVNPKRA